MASAEATPQQQIDQLKVNAGWDMKSNIKAGLLHHEEMEKKATKTVTEYIEKFADVLEENVLRFLQDNAEMLELCIYMYEQLPAYKAVKSRGILSAKRFYDTYVLRTADGSCYESVSHCFMRIAAFCTVQVLTNSALKITILYLGRDKLFKDLPCSPTMDLFIYFFSPLSHQLVCCATPIMRSAGLRDANLASCFLINPDLSTEKSTTTALLQELTMLLSAKSGVGCNVTSFGVDEKCIQSCVGLINSQVEFFNDQNPRPVSVAAYMEVWHSQIQEFLAVKLPENPSRCASIYQGLCIPKLFFEKFIEDPGQNWYLFKPEKSGNLANLYGDEFRSEYERLVGIGCYADAIPIKSLMFLIINTIIKTGSPYIIYKEACNEHHWKNMEGCAIASANLCAEVIQYPGADVSTCNLANVCLPMCLVTVSNDSHSPLEKTYCGNVIESQAVSGVGFSMPILHAAVEVAVFLVNCAIAGGKCVTPGMERGQRERSMGIGVHGLADVFAEMGYSYLDERAARLDVEIFENMYFRAVKTSNNICRLGGGRPFEGWGESKLRHGFFHWQGWEDVNLSIPITEWEKLSRRCISSGVYNSQFIALMPTVGSSLLTGFSESYYPYFANISSKVSSKEEVMKPNMTFWNRVSKEDLDTVRFFSGDVALFPEPLKEKYSLFLSAFDYCAEKQLARARLRAPFVDQSQSHSFHLKEENVVSARFLKDLILSGYTLGLKTIMYYCKVKKQSTMSSFQCLRDQNKSEMTGNDQGVEPESYIKCTAAGGETSEACLHCQ
ncbi:ribonucleotide-reductase, large subunit [Alcelaphine gammaherpesvirus 1]|uniref:Ribonucleoside-diphosphate reductase large subunit n=1 Tax=Alcelaphine herpesvirus 1 (strain C500) TaxID=654901 RepID=RIR1_ALHV1|nr:ribonucleotide-reductase, large subunit [Alcelaphine gammaherpesvirus 1]O36411.1 RecName: Full=Ribonucleoside-diphosphate reductase large subunit; Short=R1; AltName: Full=Ribonucleotide reductase large subunit [Alcelaphine herpesvirus 1 strain C500]AAC58108.1 ribonucleotide-reductase, large subunit [Alcelaphine gammaherpesvirus 1]APB09484.1 ribonucleotide reductase subunit 1 [Alcelaphine gammaherpesvirus 1]APB09556.1 ribonucleotide reductase subunit 1 [Alcelaphine gammaherpesvirus 1]QDY9229